MSSIMGPAIRSPTPTQELGQQVLYLQNKDHLWGTPPPDCKIPSILFVHLSLNNSWRQTKESHDEATCILSRENKLYFTFETRQNSREFYKSNLSMYKTCNRLGWILRNIHLSCVIKIDVNIRTNINNFHSLPRF